MSPIDGAAGYSADTRVKQEHFRRIATDFTRVARYAIAKGVAAGWASPQYLYVDLTSGPGIVDGIDGSPLIFGEVATKAQLDWYAALFDSDKSMADRLRGCLVERGLAARCTVHPRDHHDIIDLIGTFSRHGRPCYGLIYADPNGGGRIPVAAIRAVLGHPRLSRFVDVLCYVSANGAYKRRPGGSCLSDDIRACGKRYGLIREPQSKWQWTFALMTNWDDVPEYRSLGFRRIDSAAGREIVRRLELTAKQRNMPAGQEVLL